MAHIQSLPSANAKFSAKSGLGSFQNKLTHGMHAAGELSTFGHHPEAVKSLVSHVEKYQTHIRRGGLSQSQIKKIKSEVVKSDPTLTDSAKKLIGKTLSHLGERPSNRPQPPGSPHMTSTKPGRFTYNRAADTNQPQHITSIADQTGKTSSFHQFGDTVSRTKSGQRLNQIYGSVNSAIKNKRPVDSGTTNTETAITQAPPEDIKD